MGISEDWADTVRRRRFRHWDKHDGPNRVERWALEKPKRALAYMLAWEVALVLWVWLVFDDPLGACSTGIVGLFFVFAFYRMLQGERVVYAQWLEDRLGGGAPWDAQASRSE